MNSPIPVLDNVKLLRGALVQIDPDNSDQKTFIRFQYNPEKLTRTLTPQGENGNKSESNSCFIQTPSQSIDITVKLEAIREMADDKANGGVYAQLAALELLLYPTVEQIEKYWEETKGGKLSAAPPIMPRTVFVWGPGRVLPVRLNSISVVEEFYDPRLNPIRADVTLKMDLLQIGSGIPIGDDDYQLLIANLKRSERAKKRWTEESLSKEGMKNVGQWYK